MLTMARCLDGNSKCVEGKLPAIQKTTHIPLQCMLDTLQCYTTILVSICLLVPTLNQDPCFQKKIHFHSNAGHTHSPNLMATNCPDSTVSLRVWHVLHFVCLHSSQCDSQGASSLLHSF